MYLRQKSYATASKSGGSVRRDSPDGVSSGYLFAILVVELVNGAVEVRVVGGVKVGDGTGSQPQAAQHCMVQHSTIL